MDAGVVGIAAASFNAWEKNQTHRALKESCLDRCYCRVPGTAPLALEESGDDI